MPDSPSFVAAAAWTCGIFIALAVHLLLGEYGLGLASVWRQVFPSGPDVLDAAVSWWVIGAAAFLGSAAAFRTLRPRYAARRRHRVLKWLGGAVLLALLSAAGQLSHGIGGGLPHLIASLAAVGLGVVMASCGTVFAIRQATEPPPQYPG